MFATMSALILVKSLWTFSCVSLIVLVLLHSPKGDGLGGLGGQAQLFTSSKSAEKTLNQTTWVLVTMFMALTTVMSAGWLK
jgi:preprotein translocase subunit SecG